MFICLKPQNGPHQERLLMSSRTLREFDVSVYVSHDKCTTPVLDVDKGGIGAIPIPSSQSSVNIKFF